MSQRVVLSQTESVCPICLKKITADRVKRGETVFMEKICAEHGFFEVEVWGGHLSYEDWDRIKEPSTPVNPATSVEHGCPFDCGLCPAHRQHSCCVLLEITERCNLGCPICFASSGDAADDPPIESLLDTMRDLLTRGGPLNIQLSGGEPSVRDDVPRIIQEGKKMGHPFFQLNTNGIRLAEEEGYAQSLSDAGLDCVFLQFDGVTDEVYRQIRGRDLFDIKKKAIEACQKAGIGVVLVPTLLNGVNIKEIGQILRFAAEHIPTVTGVHFQPMTFAGRYPKGAPVNRFTLSHLLYEIEKQTGGEMKMTDFSPAEAENAYCSFSGSFLVDRDNTFRAKAAGKKSSCGCGSPLPKAADRASQARAYVAKAWKGTARTRPLKSVSASDTASLDDFLDTLKNRQLAISAMTFMDAWNLDLDRLRDCYIHIADGHRLIPFCAYNLSAQNGKTLYRHK
ncbi:MAG: radical SAM protein [Clostridiales bacterium]|nr:radical SAM protein [Clostridiales bacterium]MCK9350657.1 radical SAM protein [Clostridiales bacterium]MDD3539886.1 radical SAM protein [Eubacteriales bacterium]MDY0119258.1 radical SAM protein [Clostridia bacterium]NLG30137.1 radical SAM protein [Clostridiaceae bacterium]